MSQRTAEEVLELLRAEARRQGLADPGAAHVKAVAEDSVIEDLLERLVHDGMRWVDECEGCGRDFLTRAETNYCPPCRGAVPPDERTHFALGVWRSHLLELLVEVTGY